jgi:hypothetical protein
MSTSMNTEPKRPLRTADLAAAGAAPAPVPIPRDDDVPGDIVQEQGEQGGQSQSMAATQGMPQSERLEALFPPDTTAKYRARWADVQSSFVDDPRQAVAEGDELVAEVMQSLAESFAHERERLEDDLSHTGDASTETLRVGLRRYRSFFERLLSL